MKEASIYSAYEIAKEQYAAHGIDVDAALRRLETIPISMHCWQGDDVGGFETAGADGPAGKSDHRQLSWQGPHHS